jgi:hypothetical protein
MDKEGCGWRSWPISDAMAAFTYSDGNKDVVSFNMHSKCWWLHSAAMAATN